MCNLDNDISHIVATVVDFITYTYTPQTQNHYKHNVEKNPDSRGKFLTYLKLLWRYTQETKNKELRSEGRNETSLEKAVNF